MSKEVICKGCGSVHSLGFVHAVHTYGAADVKSAVLENRFGVTHTCHCGTDLLTGRLGDSYGLVQDGSCELCEKIKRACESEFLREEDLGYVHC